MSSLSTVVYQQATLFAEDLPDHAGQIQRYTAAGLNALAARTLEERAARIMTLGRRAILDIGHELLQARNEAAHGTWGTFLARCGLEERTAQNYINVMEQFGHRPEVLQLLPPTALYALAAPSADPVVVDQVLAEAQAGAPPPTVAAVKARLAESRQASTPAPRTPAPILPARPEPPVGTPLEPVLDVPVPPPAPAAAPVVMTPIAPVAAPVDDRDLAHIKRLSMLHLLLSEMQAQVAGQLAQVPDTAPIYTCDPVIVRSAAAALIAHQALQAQAGFLSFSATEVVLDAVAA